ncbi:Uncharacterised protein [Staphylococcus piscifermentans]|uniref:Uncharacterized protein n=1 Tax=Staphylococcus piscifermentans TaxID=70258 RepID=A0A239TJB1_9STAP|nr:hypothetical protein [Staphylococcus piscifermentans]RTX85230.1 hypothetical protein CD139_04305 [Staphylococcus piscifermentans]GEP85719.1 hypothetical protein SPI02_23040 [Staphylococcus piscifermentans]SNU97298.1 Uncharacterised protein [Staphylococcus piscifermentans]
MTRPASFLVEGTLKDILEVLPKISNNPKYDVTEIFKLDDPEAALYRYFAKEISTKEKKTIENLIKDTYYLAHIGEDEAKNLKYLSMTNYLLPIEKEVYYVDNEFLNNYNHYVLKDKYPELPAVSLEVKNTVSGDYLIEKERREEDNITFKDFLDFHYSVDELKNICRTHKIKGFSKGPKSHIIQLIEADFRANPDNYLSGYPKSAYALLAYLIIEDRNSISFLRAHGLNLAFFIAAESFRGLTYYIPADTLGIVKSFFQEHQMDPSDYIKSEDKEFYEGLPALEEEDFDWEADIDWEKELKDVDPELTEQAQSILEYLENMTPEGHVLTYLADIYGIVSYTFAAKMLNHLLEENNSEAEVKAIAKDTFEDSELKEQVYINPALVDVYPDIEEYYEDTPYYEPESLEDLTEYDDKHLHGQDPNTQDAIKFFRKLIKDNDEDFQLMSIDLLILSPLKSLITFEDADQILQELKNADSVRKFNELEAKRQLKKIYNHIRLWKYRGHTKAEFDAMQNN